MNSESESLKAQPLITKVPPRPVDIKRPDGHMTVFSRLPLEPLQIPSTEEQEQNNFSIFEQLEHTAKTTWLYVRLVPYLFSIIKGLVMQNWKTTTTAVLGALAALLNYATGLVVPTEVIAFITMCIGFFFAGDGRNNND
jgi:hypothetical protein